MRSVFFGLCQVHSRKFLILPLAGIITVVGPLDLEVKAQTQAKPAQQQSAQAGQVAAKAQSAQQQKPTKSPEELAKRMEVLLAAWEQRSALVKELDAEFSRKDHSPAWQENTEYKGRALLKSPDLAYLDFEKLNPEDKKFTHHERIICTGKDVYHYQTPSRQIFIYPLSAEERARALEEGPLPFLFNMRAEKAKTRYKMSLLDENEQGAWIQILPLEKFDQESFSKVYVLLNKQQFLPDRLILYAPNGKDTQDYKFKTIKMNSNIDNANFVGTVPAKGWDVIRNPAGASQPTSSAVGQPTARAGQPASGVRPNSAAPVSAGAAPAGTPVRR